MTTITIVDSLWRHNENCCYANMRSQGQAFVCWHLNLSVTCGTVVPRRWTCLSVILPYSTILVQVMAWCSQATSHYLSQCWTRSLLPHGVTRPEWVNHRVPTLPWQWNSLTFPWPFTGFQGHFFGWNSKQFTDNLNNVHRFWGFAWSSWSSAMWQVSS